MPRDRSEIAGILEEIALMLEIQGENTFKVRAYQNAARALGSLEEDLDTLIAEDRLRQINGIGQALVEKIATLRSGDSLPLLEDLRSRTPAGLLEMAEIPGLGPRKIKALYGELGIDSIGALRLACEEGRVSQLEGFGKKSEEKLLTGIRNRAAYSARHYWWTAHQTAIPILEELRALPTVKLAEVGGSLRRLAETVGDLDFLCAADDPESVMDWFASRAGVAEVSARGATKSSVRYENGLQADLRVVPEASFYFTLHYFTGSKEHNVKMRQRALDRGFSLSEWGLKAEKEGAQPAGPAGSEGEVFEALGLSWIPPELREGTDEIERAEKGDFPELVCTSDLRGCFHNHTNASDGRNTLEEMAAAADELGWEYLGIADHSKASFQANGLDEERLLEQVDRIRQINTSGKFRVHLFAGNECDILKDGSLDLDDSVLDQLDYVVASVHSSFSLSEEEMTRRIVRALEHPAVTMLGHPTGRLLLRREPYRVNLHKVIDAAAANGKIIEINAHPARLDMDWRYWRRASGKGVLASINPDAHETVGLRYVAAGVNVARKGWLTQGQVLNAWPLPEVRKRLGAG